MKREYPLMHHVSEHGRKQDERDKSRAPAIVSKGDKGALLKILHQEFRAQVSGDAREHLAQ